MDVPKFDGIMKPANKTGTIACICIDRNVGALAAAAALSMRASTLRFGRAMFKAHIGCSGMQGMVRACGDPPAARAGTTAPADGLGPRNHPAKAWGAVGVPLHQRAAGGVVEGGRWFALSRSAPGRRGPDMTLTARQGAPQNAAYRRISDANND